MGYIPKGAQKRLNAISAMRKNTLSTLSHMSAEVNRRVHEEAGGIIPRRMELGITPRHVVNAYDVYFNGKKQTLCTVADVDKGYIKRYIRGVGRKPVANKEGTYDMETLFGKVEIISKGVKYEQASGEAGDSGAAGQAPDDYVKGTIDLFGPGDR